MSHPTSLPICNVDYRTLLSIIPQYASFQYIILKFCSCYSFGFYRLKACPGKAGGGGVAQRRACGHSSEWSARTSDSDLPAGNAALSGCTTLAQLHFSWFRAIEKTLPYLTGSLYPAFRRKICS
jgi:hypothetical protein